jgi:mannose-6-phosphate isomerase
MVPMKLFNNRVRRSYTGGKLLEQWQGIERPTDSDKPEEWLASVVEARNNTLISGEGLSQIRNASGSREKLVDLINRDGKAILGEAHIKRYGLNPAVLTKMLDAAVRLSIQVHPSREFARTHFHSAYGKTEAWYVMGGRTINGEPPYVLVGFKPGITREKWKEYFDNQDIDGMIRSLHKFYVRPGDVFLIEGGLPHAIGSGCFLIEIQEPTDYTMRVERRMFDGTPIPDVLCHQGLGFDKMLDCFHYEGLTEEEVRRKCFRSHGPMEEHGPIAEHGPGEGADNNQVIDLVNREDTPCFSMSKLFVKTDVSINVPSFITLIVLRGNGILSFGKESESIGSGYEPIGKGSEPIRQSDAYCLPAVLDDITISNTGDSPLEIILCYPPTPAGPLSD